MLELLAPKVPRADHAFGVDHIDRRPTAYIPRGRKRPARRAVEGVPPGDFVVFQDFLDDRPVAIAIDSDKREGFVFEFFDHFLLVRNHASARSSPESPKSENHHFSAVIAQ